MMIQSIENLPHDPIMMILKERNPTGASNRITLGHDITAMINQYPMFRKGILTVLRGICEIVGADPPAQLKIKCVLATI